MNGLVLFSSANKNGNTAKLVEHVNARVQFEVVEIDMLNITPYNYQNKYPSDDFYALVDKILMADILIFASPVYWHAVTAPMKALIDRITELTDVNELKAKARALANKKAYLVATSANEQLCPIYEGFFSRVFNYFDIEYGGFIHVNCRDGFYVESESVNSFAMKLNTEKCL